MLFERLQISGFFGMKIPAAGGEGRDTKNTSIIPGCLLLIKTKLTHNETILQSIDEVAGSPSSCAYRKYGQVAALFTKCIFI